MGKIIDLLIKAGQDRAEPKRHRAEPKRYHAEPGYAPAPKPLLRTDTERSAKPGAANLPSRVESYTLVKKIGEGGQGKTELVQRRSDNKLLIRKEQKRYQIVKTREWKMPTEMYIFEHIIGPTSPYSIVKFDHCNYTSQNMQTLYFEFCAGGDIDHMLRSNIQEKRVWQCFTQIADALAFLHYGYNPHSRHPCDPPKGWHRVIHRDVKPANIFLRRKPSSGEEWQCVLGDFGLATMEDENVRCGTGEWIGPEVPKMTARGDVWSLGAVVHAMCHGQSPCDDPPKGWPKSEVDQWFWRPEARNPKPLPSQYSDTLNKEMFHCLTKNPAKRYNSLEVVESLASVRCNGYR